MTCEWLAAVELLSRYWQLMVNSTVMGWQNRLKFIGKTSRLKISLQNVYFYCFGLISCMFLIFLIEIWSFCTNLLENYPSHKIDQLPLLRILSSCTDHSTQTRINSLYLFLLFLFTPLALFGQNDVSLDPYNCFSLYNSFALSLIKHRCSSASNAWKHTPIYGSPFNLSAFDL